MDDIEIAVVVPTRDRVQKTIRAILSVKEQTSPAQEIIVVDDGSEESNARKLERFCSKNGCAYVFMKKEGHPGVARALGARISNSGYVAFLDSDDEWLPNKLEVQREYLRKPRSAQAVFSNAISKRDFGYEKFHTSLKAEYSFGDLVMANRIVTSTVIVNRELLESVGWFSVTPSSRLAEDYSTWLRIASLAKWHALDQALVVYENLGIVSDRWPHPYTDILGIVDFLYWHSTITGKRAFPARAGIRVLKEIVSRWM